MRIECVNIILNVRYDEAPFSIGFDQIELSLALLLANELTLHFSINSFVSNLKPRHFVIDYG